MLLAFAVAWGALRTKTETMDVRLGKVEKAIDCHHSDNDRHVDIHWRKQLGDQMNRIESLLVDHLTHGGSK
jgi:hypothetical protein